MASGYCWWLFSSAAVGLSEVPADASCFAGRGLFGPSERARSTPSFRSLLKERHSPRSYPRPRAASPGENRPREGALMGHPRAGGALLLPVVIALARGPLLTDDPRRGVGGTLRHSIALRRWECWRMDRRHPGPESTSPQRRWRGTLSAPVGPGRRPHSPQSHRLRARALEAAGGDAGDCNHSPPPSRSTRRVTAQRATAARIRRRTS